MKVTLKMSKAQFQRFLSEDYDGKMHFTIDYYEEENLPLKHLWSSFGWAEKMYKEWEKIENNPIILHTTRFWTKKYDEKFEVIKIEPESKT